VVSERITCNLGEPAEELLARSHGNEGLGESGDGLECMRVGAAE
jgi:hypothetical protein